MKIKVLVFFVLLTIFFLASIFISIPKASANYSSQKAYDYELVYQSPYPSILKPGETTNVYIEIKNTGTLSWFNNGNQVTRLGSGSQYGNVFQQRDYSSEFANTNWPSPNRPAALKQSQINPGFNAIFQFDIKVPSNPGIYKAYFTPVVDGVSWMKDLGIYWQIEVQGDNNQPQTKLQIKSGNTNNTSSVSLSVVKLICREDADFKYLSQGSGTLFRNNSYKYTYNPFYLTTNLHVVKTKDGSVPKCIVQIFNDNQSNYVLYKSEGYKGFGDNIDFAIVDIKPWNEYGIGDTVYEQIASYAEISYSKYNFAGMDYLTKIALDEKELSGTVINNNDKLTLFGYPSFGGKNITISTGSANGEISYKGSQYIKTNAKVGPGFSGGLAINDSGKIVGIPSMMMKSSNESTIGYILYFHNLSFLN